MARATSRHPTELELEILKILWERGPCRVREVRDALVGFRELAYTSVMTIMTIMLKKGYLKRTKEGASYTYVARVTQESTVRDMLGDLVERVFDGSAAAAMVHLLDTAEVDEAELGQLRRLIRRKAREQKP